MKTKQTIADHILRYRFICPEAIAIEFMPGAEISYADLGKMVDSYRFKFQTDGVGQGSIVIVSIRNELIFLLAVLAISSLGGICLILRRSMLGTSTNQEFISLKPNFFVTDSDKLTIQNVSQIVLSKEQHIDALINKNTKSTDIIENTAARLTDDDSDLFSLIIGSGSTGKPKKFHVSNDQELAHIETRVKAFELTRNDIVGTLTHVEFTTARRHIFSALFAGSKVKLYEKDVDFDIELFATGVTVLHLPVVSLNKLINHFAGNSNIFKKLRILSTGGSVVSEDLRHKTHEMLTKNLHIVYGTNELGFLTIAKPDEWLKHPGSIGRPIEGVELEVVNNLGMSVSSGELGQLRFRKSNMMANYLDNPEMTARNFKDGWFYPQDIGIVGFDGIVRHVGRADDMMIFNGINVYPSEIEFCIQKIPGVLDVAALPLHHPVHQDVPVCAVVIDQMSSLNSSQIQKWCNPLLGPIAPRFILLVDEIPRDEQGKLMRVPLRKILAAKINSMKN